MNEKLVFHRLSYEHQLEFAEKFLSREPVKRSKTVRWSQRLFAEFRESHQG